MTTEISNQPSVDQQILRELKKMNKIMTLANAPTLERELSRYASSEERKRIWAAVDGKRKPSEIAKEIGLSTRTVEIFVKVLAQAELIESRTFGEPPKRIIDFVPANWVELSVTKAIDTKGQNSIPGPISLPASGPLDEGNTNG